LAWVRIDDTAPHHKKQLKAGPAACWLWVCGLAYGQRLNTDHIPTEALPHLGVGNYKKLAGFLCSAGLWTKDSDGYCIHDFHDFHATPEERSERQAKRKDRNARYYQGSKSRLKTDSKTDCKTVLSPSYEKASDGEPEPEPKPNKDKAASGPRIYDRTHADHLVEFCPFVCLSDRKLNEFAKTLPGGLSDLRNFDRALAWASKVKEAWGQKPIVELKWWEFWEARWRERAAVKPTSSDVRSVEETREWLRSKGAL
jgi:hypothetical protein